MFKEERHAEILKYIEENGKISTSQIQRMFSVGYGTAMNDLDELADRGLVQRTHGGALKLKQVGYAPDGIRTLSSKERCAEITENYLKIARKAVSLLEENDVIYLTSASLGYIMAMEIPTELSLTAVVNSISIAEGLRHKPKVRVVVTGGEMHENGNFYDDFTLAMLRRIKFDKCFLTSAACTASFGLSVQTARNIGLMNTVIENSRTVIGMYPAEKLGRDSILQICPANAMNLLITEADASDEECTALTNLGVEVVKTN
ncbi:MAG: DeoR/GlpR family DNA-binding transcription regulator [Eubacteriales bacterium]